MNAGLYQNISIPVGGVKLKGDLSIPGGAEAIIIFSPAGGTNPCSSRGRVIAQHLIRNGFGVFMPDLLSGEEGENGGKTYDIELCAKRLAEVTKWLKNRDLFDNYKIGYYGTSTGAAAALMAAAEFPELVGAIVVRGGRPDLAFGALSKVAAPTLLIIGQQDHFVLQLNREAFALLTCDKRLEIVENADYQFEEPEKLNEVAELTTSWFRQHLIESYPLKPRPITSTGK